MIAARLRKDTTSPASEKESEQLVDIIAQVMELKMDADSTPSPTTNVRMVSISEPVGNACSIGFTCPFNLLSTPSAILWVLLDG